MGNEITAVSLQRTYSVEVWKTRIASCRSSGRSVWAWCAENAINTQTYYRWERRVLSAAVEPREPVANSRFAEIPLTGSSEIGSTVAAIRVGGMECEIRGGMTEAFLN